MQSCFDFQMLYSTLFVVVLAATLVIGKPVADVPLPTIKCGACFEQERSLNGNELPATIGLGNTSGDVEGGATGATSGGVVLEHGALLEAFSDRF